MGIHNSSSDTQSSNIQPFASLADPLKATISDTLHTLMRSSTGDAAPAIAQIAGDIFTSWYTSRDAVEYIGRLKILDLMGMTVLSGLMPGRLDLVARACNQASESFFALRKEAAQLSSQEREALISYLPERLSPMLHAAFNQEWEPSNKTQRILVTSAAALSVVSKVVATASTGLTQAGTTVISQLTPLALKISEQVIAPDTQAKIGSVWRHFEETFIKGFVIEGAASIVADQAQQLIGMGDKQIGVALSSLTNNFQFVEKVLEKTDQVFKTLPPATLVASAFHSLDAFSEVNVEVSQALINLEESQKPNFLFAWLQNLPKGPKVKPVSAWLKNLPKDLLDIPQALKPAIQERLKLYHAAQKGLLPTAVMNKAFLALSDPKDYTTIPFHTKYVNVLEQAVPSSLSRNSIETNQAYSKFLLQHKLQSIPETSLTLVKAAFFAKNLANGREQEHIRFLAEVILSSPEEFSKEPITTDQLLKKSNFLYVKQHLYPTLVKKFLPDNFNDLLSSLSKLTHSDLQDSISTAVAHAIVNNGLDYLTNPQTLSQLILQTLGMDLTPFADSSVGDGTATDIQKRFGDLCDNLGTPDYRKALEALAVTKSTKSSEQRSEEAFAAIDTTMRQKVTGLPRVVKNYIFPALSLDASTAFSIGAQAKRFAKQKDWGLFTLMLTGRLNKNLLDPTSSPPLDLTNKHIKSKLKRIIKKVYPALRGIGRIFKKFIPNFLIASTLKGIQTTIESIKYDHLIDSIKNNLQYARLTKRLMDCLPFPEGVDKSSIQQGISVGLYNHIQNSMKSIWGIEPDSPEFALYSKKYVTFLLKQSKKDLLETMKSVNHTPGEIRKKFIKESEAELQKTTREVDQILMSQPKILSIPHLTHDYVSQALKDINKKIKNIQTQLSLPPKLALLKEALAYQQARAKPNARFEEETEVMQANPFTAYSIENLKTLIAETTEKIRALNPTDSTNSLDTEQLLSEQEKLLAQQEELMQVQESFNLKEQSPLQQPKIQVNIPQLEKLKTELNDQQQELECLYKANGSPSNSRIILELEQQIKLIESDIVESRKIISHNQSKLKKCKIPKDRKEINEVIKLEKERKADLKQKLTIKKRTLREWKISLDETETRIQSKTAEFDPHVKFEKLLKMRQQLTDLTNDSTKDYRELIGRLKKGISVLENSIKRNQEKFEAIKRQERGDPLVYDIGTKLEFLEMMIQHDHLKQQPLTPPNKAKLAKLAKQMKHSYKKLLKNGYRMGAGFKTIEEGQTMKSQLSTLQITTDQAVLKLHGEMTALDKRIEVLSEKSQGFPKRHAQLKAQIKDMETVQAQIDRLQIDRLSKEAQTEGGKFLLITEKATADLREKIASLQRDLDNKKQEIDLIQQTLKETPTSFGTRLFDTLKGLVAIHPLLVKPHAELTLIKKELQLTTDQLKQQELSLTAFHQLRKRFGIGSSIETIQKRYHAKIKTQTHERDKLKLEAERSVSIEEEEALEALKLEKTEKEALYTTLLEQQRKVTADVSSVAYLTSLDENNISMI